MKWLIIALVLSSVAACVFPDRIELWYPINVTKLKENEYFNYGVIKEYEDFFVSVSTDGLRIVCTKKYFNCIDNTTFRNLLDEMENYGAFDLSKEDKDSIASLFERNVIIKRMKKVDLLKIKIKELIMRFLGKLFCVNYEKLKACNNEWCSLTVEKSDKCPILKC